MLEMSPINQEMFNFCFEVNQLQQTAPLASDSRTRLNSIKNDVFSRVRTEEVGRLEREFLKIDTSELGFLEKKEELESLLTKVSAVEEKITSSTIFSQESVEFWLKPVTEIKTILVFYVAASR